MGKPRESSVRDRLVAALAQALYDDRRMVAYFIEMAIREHDDAEQRQQPEMKLAA